MYSVTTAVPKLISHMLHFPALSAFFIKFMSLVTFAELKCMRLGPIDRPHVYILAGSGEELLVELCRFRHTSTCDSSVPFGSTNTSGINKFKSSSVILKSPKAGMISQTPQRCVRKSCDSYAM